MLPCASGVRVLLLLTQSCALLACMRPAVGGFAIYLLGEQKGWPWCPLTVGIIRQARCRPPRHLAVSAGWEVGFGKVTCWGPGYRCCLVAEPLPSLRAGME